MISFSGLSADGAYLRETADLLARSEMLKPKC